MQSASFHLYHVCAISTFSDYWQQAKIVNTKYLTSQSIGLKRQFLSTNQNVQRNEREKGRVLLGYLLFSLNCPKY